MNSDSLYEAQALNSFSNKYLGPSAESPQPSFFPIMKDVYDTVKRKTNIAKEGMKVTQELEKLKKMRSKEALDALLNTNNEAGGEGDDFISYLLFVP